MIMNRLLALSIEARIYVAGSVPVWIQYVLSCVCNAVFLRCHKPLDFADCFPLIPVSTAQCTAGTYVRRSAVSGPLVRVNDEGHNTSSLEPQSRARLVGLCAAALAALLPSSAAHRALHSLYPPPADPRCAPTAVTSLHLLPVGRQ